MFMLRGSKLFAIFLIGLLLLVPARLVLAVWDAEITYLGETLDDGYSWSQDLPFDGYVWDPLAWDFIYGVKLVDNDSDISSDHPIDHFQVGNPYGAEWTITYTPQGWWPDAGISGTQETISVNLS